VELLGVCDVGPERWHDGAHRIARASSGLIQENVMEKQIATCDLYDSQPIHAGNRSMTLSLYDASVPVFKQMLGGLDAVLAKAQALAADRKFEPNALTQSRLYPDMFPLSKQVQIACDFARGVSARLAGVDVPAYEDKETTFDELRALIAKTLAFVDSVDAAAFDSSASREIVLRPGTPKEKRLSGTAYLLSYGLPQFFFHVTTAYALLRHNGVEVGKRDYMGAY